ncbi:MAG TPA: Uma2 family endonuclease [Bryobacteraceae bacterium]|jgi:Uma2 family endonuclease|nr:Uma2 family endonuclease [Bryobacteraceae bacterium]
MAAIAEPLLMTVEQYRDLPHRDDVIQELHWGQVITLTRPKMKHAKLQSRLVRLLRPRAEHLGVIESEVAFRALPEYDLRGADVAFVSQQRWNTTKDDDNLHGTPELVIEVLSPSNTKQEMREKAALYLSTGAQEFWLVDPKRQTVTVMRQQGGTQVFGMGQPIPLVLFGRELNVSDIFA